MSAASQPVRTAVVGAGAIGGLIAAAAVRAGHAVSVLARGKTLDALRTDGLKVIDDTRESVVQVNAGDAPASFGVQDYVVIALKAQTLPAIAASLRPMIGPDTVIVAAMNGLPWWFAQGLAGPLEGQHIEAVDPGGSVSAALPPARSIGCVVHLSSSTDGPGVVRRGRGNQLIVGAPSGRLNDGPNANVHASLHEAAAAFAAAMRAGGFEVALSDSIREEIWAKLWGNMNMNPLSALTGSTADRLLDDPLTHALVLRMMEEAGAIGARLGLSTGMSPAERVVVTRRLGAFKTSMLQDFEAGRPLEVDPILGVFPELGRKLNIPTPFCDAVLGLLRQRAANSGL
jgi:2-dehydropantoate 2-reductase